MRPTQAKASEVARRCRDKSLVCQEYAKSAFNSGDEWGWYYRAFTKIAEHLERDRERYLAMEPGEMVEVPGVLMK